MIPTKQNHQEMDSLLFVGAKRLSAIEILFVARGVFEYPARKAS